MILIITKENLSSCSNEKIIKKCKTKLLGKLNIIYYKLKGYRVEVI